MFDGMLTHEHYIAARAERERAAERGARIRELRGARKRVRDAAVIERSAPIADDIGAAETPVRPAPASGAAGG